MSWTMPQEGDPRGRCVSSLAAAVVHWQKTAAVFPAADDARHVRSLCGYLSNLETLPESLRAEFRSISDTSDIDRARTLRAPTRLDTEPLLGCLRRLMRGDRR